MRAFLGVPIPDSLKPQIMRIQRKFDYFDIKFVEKENLHFNLRFFRDIDEDKLDSLNAALKKVCSQFEPFEIGISGIGAFPSKNYVRVIWLGVKKGYQTFKTLGEMVGTSVESIGFEKESNFVPHLTLGRVRSGRNKNELLVLMRKMEEVEIGKMKIDKLVLFQSKLSPKGPVYEEVFSIKLDSYSHSS
jgi:2'-5' RNA ligase